MNKTEFIKQLEKRLKRLPKEDREDAIRYYEEYFEEMGADDSTDVTNTLGAPDEIAREIIATCTEKHMDAQKERGGIKNNTTVIWMIILGICASPVAVPLAFAAIICLVALLRAFPLPVSPVVLHYSLQHLPPQDLHRSSSA